LAIYFGAFRQAFINHDIYIVKHNGDNPLTMNDFLNISKVAA